MLFGKPTPYGTGINITGDYYDLQDLYSMIWMLTDTTEVESPESLLLLKMAYEIRKGFEEQREQVNMGSNEMNKASYFSVKLLPAQELAHWITGYRLNHEPLLTQKITDINLRHLSEPNGKNRFRRLPEKMRILIPLSPESRIFEQEMNIQAKQMKCEPKDLDIGEEEFDLLKWKW